MLKKSAKRSVVVAVRFNTQEIELLDKKRERVKLSRAAYLRSASVKRMPASVPTINQKLWIDLAKVGNNLNQYLKLSRLGKTPYYPTEIMAELQQLLAETRQALLRGKAGSEESL